MRSPLTQGLHEAYRFPKTLQFGHIKCDPPFPGCLPVTATPPSRDSRKNGGQGGHLSSEVGCVGEEEDQQRLDDADPLGEACGQGQEEGKD